MKWMWLSGVAMLLWVVEPSFARSPTAPPVSAESLVGTWEATMSELPRLLVLQIGGVEPSKVTLVMITGPGTPSTIVFRATEIRLKVPGQVVLRARGEGGDAAFTAELRVRGAAFGQSGSMSGTLAVQRETDTGPPSRWPIFFVKSEEGLVKWLSKAESTAQQILGRPAGPP